MSFNEKKERSSHSGQVTICSLSDSKPDTTSLSAANDSLASRALNLLMSACT